MHVIWNKKQGAYLAVIAVVCIWQSSSCLDDLEEARKLFSSLLANSLHLLSDLRSASFYELPLANKGATQILRSVYIVLIPLSFSSVLLSCHFLFFFKLSTIVSPDWVPVL